MARAHGRIWLRMALWAALAVTLGGIGVALVRAQDRPSRAQTALAQGIDYYRRGDYELAAQFLEQAQQGQDGLNPTERQELATQLQRNGAALKARADGAEQLNRAEEAIRAGRSQDAGSLLKEVSGNQFITPTDRQRAERLTQQVRSGAVRPSQPTPPPEAAAPLALARAKLQQARALLTKGDYAAAETLAREADSIGAVYGPTDDTPGKVRADIARARTAALAKTIPAAKPDAKAILASGRQALEHGDLDRAEQLAHEADKAESMWSMHIWGDSPSKLLKDVQAARAKAAKEHQPGPGKPSTPPHQDVAGPAGARHAPGNPPSAVASKPKENAGAEPPPPDWGMPSGTASLPTPTPPKPDNVIVPPPPPVAAPAVAGGAGSTPPKPASVATTPSKPATVTVAAPPPPPDAGNQAARQLLTQGRKALQDGDLSKARDLADQAVKKHPTLAWWEDNPDKLMADIRRAESKSSAGPPAPGTDASHPAPTADAHALLRQAREKYDDGKLDEAKDLCQRAAAVPGTTWGLFETTPEKLLNDINKLRHKRELDDAAKLLVEARKHYEKGEYDEAEHKANRAEHLHGPYSIWDLGDRPQKVLADVQTARAKERKVKLPPPPPTMVAQDSPKPTPESTRPATPPMNGGAPASPPVVAANKPAPNFGGPVTPPAVVAPLAPPVSVAVTPPAVVAPLAPPVSVAVTPPAVAGLNPSAPPAPGSTDPFASRPIGGAPPEPAAPVADLNKQNAQRLVAEARALQRDGRLIEARQKVLEAQRTDARFRIEEDPPERVLLELMDQCNKRIALLMESAAPPAGAAPDAAWQHKTEVDLAQARQLAVAFGLDTQPIDLKVSALHTTSVAQAPNLLNVPPSAVVPPPPSPGTGDVVPAQMQVNTARQRGLELLDKARLELRNGNTVIARRLAEEAYSGPYEARSEAEALLRQCDVEDWNQKQLAAERAFDAGVGFYKRRDFKQAYAVFQEIDPGRLPPEKKAHLKEIMMTVEMQPGGQAMSAPPPAPPSMAPSMPAGTASPTPADGQATPVSATAPNGNYAAEVNALQQIEFDRLRDDGLRAMAEATQRFQTDTDAAFEILNAYRSQLDKTNLDPERVAMLRRPIEARLQQFKTLKAQKDFEQLLAAKNMTATTRESKRQLAEQEKHRQVKELVEKYNQLRKEGKFKEAEMAAAEARELDPDNPAMDAMIYSARMLKNLAEVQDGRRAREDMFVHALNDAENPGPNANTNEPMIFDKAYKDRVKNRQGSKSIEVTKRTEQERKIERALENPITLEFKDATLKQVCDDVHNWTGLNVVLDERALNDQGISTDRPLSKKLDGISLKSALNLLLRDVHLTWVIQDEVLLITTEDNAKGRQIQKTFPVADLIIPVDNYVVPPSAQLQKVLAQRPDQFGNVSISGVTPYQVPTSIRGGEPVSTFAPGSLGGSTGAGSSFGSDARQGVPSSAGGNPVASDRQPGQMRTMEDLLIRLITNTIKPQSWVEVGGQGTIDYFPLGMALVINQTPDVQEQVQELLDALRRLQDLEVSVEVRMISLSESFFERIGVDFNLNLDTNSNTQSLQPRIVTQQFQPLNFINNIGQNAHNNIVGLQPGGAGTSFTPGEAFTQDLALPLHSSSYQYAIPPFGGYPGIPGSDGGISMGLAFLSQIQVYLFMEAAQGDRRMNVMQAPKLTLFNGQSSTIQIQDFQYFITNVQVVQSGGQVVFVPQNQPVPVGVNLAVQAVVSADRRFVRLNLAPTLTNVASATVPLFPITTFITPVFEGGAQGSPVPFTQFIQQPTFTSVTIQTTVSVPDGGTVLLGGLKVLNEGRNEFGPPILSKIPYLDRLFKNVGYGRDTSSLLIMVTPRVIINAEEEFRQTGVDSGGPGGTGGIER